MWVKQTLLLFQNIADINGMPQACSSMSTVHNFLTLFLLSFQVTLWLTVSQPVRLGVEPLPGLMTRYYVACMTVAVFVMWCAPSDEVAGLSLVWVCLCHLGNMYKFTYIHYIIHLNTANTIHARPLPVQALYSRLCLILVYRKLQRQLRHLNGHRLDRRQV
jgi:hypothetical protein